MATVLTLPDQIEIEVGEGQTLLQAGLKQGVAFAHACRGNARCSTCRVRVIEGAGACSAPSEEEAALAARLGLPAEMRLACQLRPLGDVTVHRLVIDESDLKLSNQLERKAAPKGGEEKVVAVLFADVEGFTGIAARLSAYDALYLLNRFFVEAGEIVEAHQGYVDKFIGDGLMAVFGMEDQADAASASLRAAQRMLTAADRLRPYFQRLYDVEFQIRIGVHYGPALIGTLGAAGAERLTAIGDVVNVANRIEGANKAVGTRLLFSQALMEATEEIATRHVTDAALRGVEARMALYTPEG